MPRLVIRENLVELDNEMFPASQVFLRISGKGKVMITKREISGMFLINEEPRIHVDSDIVIIEGIPMDIGGEQRVKITVSRKNIIVQQSDKYYLTDEVELNIDNSPIILSISFEHRQVVLYARSLEIQTKPFKVEIVVKSRE
ncbi:MAG: hypothetical protein QXP02_05610 [Desulfurococcaceae archaeon]